MERKTHSVPASTAARMFTVLAVCCALAVLLPAAGRAAEEQEHQKKELYQWKDDKGVVHISDDAGNIPRKYRSRAEKIESVKGAEPAQLPPEPEVRSGPGGKTEDQAEERLRRMWRVRMQEWRDRLANAEKRLHELEQKRDAARTRWAGGDSGRLDLLIEAQRIEEEMKLVREEIDEAKNQLEEVLPEEARRTGIPPGWLRE